MWSISMVPFEGKPVNLPSIEAILRKVKIPVQLSGGIRDLATIEGVA